jgi:DNA-binding NarL/FixJ family response regulator
MAGAIVVSTSHPPDCRGLRLPDSSDLSLLERIRTIAPGATVVIVTAFGTPEITLER